MYQSYEFKPEEILVYLRKSRSDDPYLSVEDVLQKHEEIIREWIGRNLVHDIPAENFYREVVSGETIADRPEFCKVLRQVESLGIKGVLVVEVQRLSRGDLEDAGRLIKILRYTHTKVITPQKIYDIEDDYDRDFFERELKRGNEYLEYTKKILARGKYQSVKDGWYIASKPPFGFVRVTVQDGKRKRPTLDFGPDAPTVRYIFDRLNAGVLPYTVAKELKAMGANSPAGKPWTVQMLLDIAKNDHYDQMIAWKRRGDVSRVKDGEVVKSRPRSKDYELFPARHPRMIDHDVFVHVQELLKNRSRKRDSYEQVNPVAGIAYCGICGRAMMYHTGLRNGKFKYNPRLVCSGLTNCEAASCLFSEYSQALVSSLLCSIEDCKIELEEESDGREKEAQIQMLEKQVQTLELKELHLWEKYADGEMPKEIFDKLNLKNAENKESAQKALDQLRNEQPQKEQLEKKIAMLSDAIKAIESTSLSAKEKNAFLKTVIERIEYSRTHEEAKSHVPFRMSVKLRI